MNDDAKKWIWWAIPIAVVIAVGAALYFGYKQEQPELRPQADVAEEPASVEPSIQHPIAQSEAEPEEPLPSLEESDDEVQTLLSELFGRPLEQFLVPNNIIRHTVATIDNLPRKKAAVQRRPIKPMPGEFIVNRTDSEITLSEDNFERYDSLVALLQKADAEQVAALYRRYYPLLQQSYADLGYPEGYFNDRLVEVIDHLLATPDVQGPINLTQPGMFYEYADPSLEARSAGQKLLIRMGPANAAVVKEKLGELRQEVTKQEAKQLDAR